MPQENKKLSIIMANYNNGQYLRTAITTVINQTFKKWELIIVDDASIDNSIEIITPFLSDARIRLITNLKNSGCGHAKRTGASNATGDIFAILDSDDALAENSLETMVWAYLNNQDCGLIYSNYYICDENLKIRGISDWVGEVENTNLHKPRTSHFLTFTRSAYEKTSGFDPGLTSAVDKDIIFKLEEVTKLRFINKPIYYYRKNDQGVSQAQQVKRAYLNFVLAGLHAYQRRLINGYANISDREITYRLVCSLSSCLRLHDWEKFRAFSAGCFDVFRANRKLLLLKNLGKKFLKKLVFRKLS